MTREYGGPLLYIRAKFSQIIRMKYQNSEYNLQTSTDISKGKCTCYCLCGEVVWGTPMQSHSIPIPFSYFNSAPLITNSTQGSSQHSLQGSQLIWLHTCFVPVHQGKKYWFVSNQMVEFVFFWSSGAFLTASYAESFVVFEGFLPQFEVLWGGFSQENLLSRSGILATSILRTELYLRFDLILDQKIYILPSVYNSLMRPQTDCCFQSK